MRIECSVDSVFGLNSYCLIEDQHALLIGPADIRIVRNIADKDAIDFIVITHEHYDHICGVNIIKNELNLKVTCGEKAQRGLSDPVINLSRYVEYLSRFIPFGTGKTKPCDYSCHADQYLRDEDRLLWQGHELLIKETPGHSAGSIAILLDNKYLFCGDTVFKNYPTATRLPGGSTMAFKTITEPWLDSLPQDILVYPGHTTPFLLKERCKSNR